MEAKHVSALVLFFKQGAIKLREPRFRKVPFSINYEVLDTSPIVRKQIFVLLDNVIDINNFDAITSAPVGAKYWPAIYADRHGLPFVLPIEVAPLTQTPFGLYGAQPLGSKMVMLNSFNPPQINGNMDQHPFVRMYNALHAVHYKVVEMITLFDADRLHDFRSYFPAQKSATTKLKHIFDMFDVLQTVHASPTSFGVDPCLATKAMHHYEHSQSWYPKNH